MTIPYIRNPLIALGNGSPNSAEIYASELHYRSNFAGVTSQFKDQAEDYHHKYTSAARSEARADEYRLILSGCGFSTGKPLNILDVGAGSGGNTLLPLVGLFPNSVYVASDLSPQLLRLLQKSVAREKLSCELTCICADISDLDIEPGTFDIAVGCSVLHHLHDPRAMLACVFGALKPGGIALFFEPYERGHAFVAMAFRQILRLNRYRTRLDTQTEACLRAMLLDWEARTGRDKSAEKYHYMDDKWLMTETYLNEQCAALGFSPVALYSPPAQPMKFTNFVKNILELHSALPVSALPEWAWAIIQELDETLSPDLGAELPLEQWCSMRKPFLPAP